MTVFDTIKYTKSVRNETQHDETSNIMINKSISFLNEIITSSLTIDTTRASNYTRILLGKK